MRRIFAALLVVVAGVVPTHSAAAGELRGGGRCPPKPGVGCDLQVRIADVIAKRSTSGVTVSVVLSGEVPHAPDAPVTGRVRVSAPTPCWPDAGRACADVVSEQESSFKAVANEGGGFTVVVGRFSYKAVPVSAEPVCNRLAIDAVAVSRRSVGTAKDVRDVCV